jgi:hypothetical protein
MSVYIRREWLVLSCLVLAGWWLVGTASPKFSPPAELTSAVFHSKTGDITYYCTFRVVSKGATVIRDSKLTKQKALPCYANYVNRLYLCRGAVGWEIRKGAVKSSRSFEMRSSSSLLLGVRLEAAEALYSGGGAAIVGRKLDYFDR